MIKINDKMQTYKCEYCGKEYQARPSDHRKYCSKECSHKAVKGKKQSPRKEKIKVTCAECGKEEYVLPSRANKYVCCSVECLAKYNSKRYSQKIKCICPICGAEFELKPSRYNKVKTIPCCSKECSSKLKETTYLGENNHQYGLKGHLNASFKGEITTKKNNNLFDIFVYKPERPDINEDGRISKHRLTVLENYEKFDPIFFTTKNNFTIFREDIPIDVHHIDCNHNNNDIKNLVPLTRSAHTFLHNKLKADARNNIFSVIGVLKQGGLLETPEVDNQQPSFGRNILEGSETNSRVLTDNAEDSNTDTSALLNNTISIVNDYIVQAEKITEEAYKQSIKEISEFEIKNSKLNT